MAGKLLVQFKSMPSLSIPTVTKGDSGKKASFYSRKIQWLLSAERFQLKLLLGAIAGIVVVLVLATTFVLGTFRVQRRDQVRVHRIEVMRLGSILQNDLAALENAFRGYLLTKDAVYIENFRRLRDSFLKHSEGFSAVFADTSEQRRRTISMRKNIQTWLSQCLLKMENNHRSPGVEVQGNDVLSAPSLLDGRKALQLVQQEEQNELYRRVEEQEWAIQSIQILDFIPKMERAVADMQKEQRAFLLTGDPAFIESYKRATSDFYTEQGHLSVLVASNPGALEQLGDIRERLETWITQFAVPDIEARRTGQYFSDPAQAGRSEGLINEVNRMMDRFEKDQIEISQTRSAAAGRGRVLIATGVDLLSALATALIIASGTYSFLLCRRQLRKLANADVRIRLVVENMLDGMVTINENGTVYSMNPAARQLFGFNGNEFSGDDFIGLIPQYYPMNSLAERCQWKHLVARTGGTVLALARTKERDLFPVEISLSEMILNEKKSYVAMIRDVTERRKFEEDLAAEKKSLAVTLASIGDGVITTDLDGNVMICNAAGEAMTGWSAAEAIGQPLHHVLAISADAATKRKRARSFAFRNEAEAILQATPERATLVSRDGTEHLVEQVASPIRDGKNDVCGVVLVFRNVTERQRDEAERRKAETLEQLGLLAGGIAHDFNNLLTAIIGNISLAALLLPPDDQMIGRLDDAKNASLRARDLAQQLLTFARGGAPIKKSASITTLIEETVSFSLRGSHSRSEITIEPALWSAEFDPGQISQVISNLAVNADQAMPAGGTLYVSCDNFSHAAGPTPAVPDLSPGDYIRIRMRDEGVGIPEGCLKQIFDPYFTTKPKGSGLGLATTYSVIKNHDGLITVESEQHRGSTFTVYLPATVRESLAIEPVASPDQPMTGSGRILVVDDEEAIRDLIDFTLSRLGYEVTGAGTALQGIDLYRESLAAGQRFDLVILDLTLPGGMGGKDALIKLIGIDPMVNAVVSSGYATDATMSRYEDFGFRGVIAKPYEAAELGRKVTAVITASRSDFATPLALEQVC